LWETSWRYARPSALKYPRAASLATSQERLVGSAAGPAKIRSQALSLQNKLKLRLISTELIVPEIFNFVIVSRGISDSFRKSNTEENLQGNIIGQSFGPSQ